MILTEAEVAERAAAFALVALTQRCTIEQAEPGDQDGYGGRENRWIVKAIDVPCRCSAAKKPNRVDEGYQSVAVSDRQIMLPLGTNVGRMDQIVIGTERYQVDDTDADTSDSLVITAYCTRKLT